MTLTIKETQVTEYENLIADLRAEVKVNDNIMERVESKIKDYENEISSLREEKNKLQDECGRLLDDTIEKDRQVENWKHRYKILSNDYEQLDQQNKVFREALKVCL